MASALIMKLPPSFSNIDTKERLYEIMDQGPKFAPENRVINLHAMDPLLRITELENVIRFLKDQQQHMLCSLHEEINILHERNRDLLFQLIFLKSIASRELREMQLYDSTDDLILHTANIEADSEVTNSATDGDDAMEPIENGTRKGVIRDIFSNKSSYNSKLRNIIEKGTREILKEILSNKVQKSNSRPIYNDKYVKDLEDKIRKQEKIIQLLRIENKEQNIEIQQLKKSLNNLMRISSITPAITSARTRNVESNVKQQQSQMFPPLQTSTTFRYSKTPNNRTSSAVTSEKVEIVPVSLPRIYSFQSSQLCFCDETAASDNCYSCYYSESSIEKIKGNRSGSCTTQRVINISEIEGRKKHLSRTG